MKSERSSKKSDATRFVVTFVGAALFALLVVVALVAAYGASGTYLFKQVVLTPSLFEEMPSKRAPFVTNKIEFVLADNLNFGLSPSDAEEFAPQILSFADEMQGKTPRIRRKKTKDTSKYPEGEEGNPKVQVDNSGKHWGRYAVSIASYCAFYHKVKSVRSIPKLSDRLVGQFALVAPSTLTLFVQKEGKELFSQIEFLDEGDAFRIRRPVDLETDLDWIYFYYPGIYKTAIDLFALQGEL